MGEAALLGLCAGAIIGALIASGAPDWAKGLGTLLVLAGAAGGMGITQFDRFESSHPSADYVNMAIVAWAILQTKYAVVFWLVGLASLAIAGFAVERIRKAEAD